MAFIVSGEMAFAYFMAHAPKSFYPAVNGGSLAVLYCFVFLYFVFAGGGPVDKRVDRALLWSARAEHSRPRWSRDHQVKHEANRRNGDKDSRSIPMTETPDG